MRLYSFRKHKIINGRLDSDSVGLLVQGWSYHELGGLVFMREKINFKNRVNEKLTIAEGFKKFITTKKAMKLSEYTID